MQQQIWEDQIYLIYYAGHKHCTDKAEQPDIWCILESPCDASADQQKLTGLLKSCQRFVHLIDKTNQKWLEQHHLAQRRGNDVKKRRENKNKTINGTTTAVGARYCCHHCSGGGGSWKRGWDLALSSCPSHGDISDPNLCNKASCLIHWLHSTVLACSLGRYVT